jgi:hypothetical protein
MLSTEHPLSAVACERWFAWCSPNVFAIEVTTKHSGTFRLRTMCYRGIPYEIDPASKEVRIVGEADALKCIEVTRRLGGYQARMIPV